MSEETMMSGERIDGFAPADDVFAVLESIPGLQDNRAERRAARDQMEREHRVGLAQIREIAKMTQVEVAERMGKTQTGVSRLEHRDDMLLSTLKGYLDAIGAEAIIALKVGTGPRQHTIKLGLDELLADK